MGVHKCNFCSDFFYLQMVASNFCNLLVVVSPFCCQRRKFSMQLPTKKVLDLY